MKKTVLFSLAALAAAGVAQAKTDFESAFGRALNYKCVAGAYINSDGAEEIAFAVDAKKFELNDFLNTYYKTCEFGRSERIAAGVKSGKSNMSAFNQAFQYKCSSGLFLNGEGAEDVALGVAAERYNTNDLLNVFYRTCELERSKRIAANAKSGKSDLAAFNRAFNYKCNSGYYIRATGAEEVAVEAAADAKKFELNDFLNTYYKTCEFERSKRIVKNAKSGKSDLAAFNRAFNYKCKNGYYIRATGAEEVASQVAAGKFQLDTFLNMFYSTCEFDRSVRLAKASKSSGGGDGTGDDQSNSGSAL